MSSALACRNCSKTYVTGFIAGRAMIAVNVGCPAFDFASTEAGAVPSYLSRVLRNSKLRGMPPYRRPAILRENPDRAYRRPAKWLLTSGLWTRSASVL
jgi:hypothetical protein